MVKRISGKAERGKTKTFGLYLYGTTGFGMFSLHGCTGEKHHGVMKTSSLFSSSVVALLQAEVFTESKGERSTAV